MRWDAEKYTADFSFVHQYGEDLIDLIEAQNGLSVLDLGCGNGALSNVLFQKGFCVKGLDSSADLLRLAQESYPKIEFIEGDATCFTLAHKVDCVFSNAVFHWIKEPAQKEMLHCVYQALKEKGQFVFEFGGYGNNQTIHQALKAVFLKHGYIYENPFYFPTIGQYAALLEETGFKVRFALLFDRPTMLKGENGLADWIRMFIKNPLENISDLTETEKIINEAVCLLKPKLFIDGKWYADYVRLRMKAIRI